MNWSVLHQTQSASPPNTDICISHQSQNLAEQNAQLLRIIAEHELRIRALEEQNTKLHVQNKDLLERRVPRLEHSVKVLGLETA